MDSKGFEAGRESVPVDGGVVPFVREVLSFNGEVSSVESGLLLDGESSDAGVTEAGFECCKEIRRNDGGAKGTSSVRVDVGGG